MANAAPTPNPNSEAESDLSMEEILQSIRRIIAEDGDEEKPQPKARVDMEVIPSGESSSASDILELTEMVHDDGTVEHLNQPAEQQPADQSGVGDVLAHIDNALAVADEKPVEIPITAFAPEPSEIPSFADMVAAAEPAMPPVAEAPVYVPPPPAPLETVNYSAHADDRLLSDEAAIASAAALKRILVPEPRPAAPPTASMPYRAGYTVEDLTLEALRPMLKTWLDANLPQIVEKIVEREVRKLRE